MLRSLVLVFLLLNAGFYAWRHGWLNEVVGARPDAQHEPQRLRQQRHADELIVLPPPATSPAIPPATSPAPNESPLGAAPPAAGASAASAAASSTVTGEAGASGLQLAMARSSLASSASSCVQAGPFTAAEQHEVEAALKPLAPARQWDSDPAIVPGLWMVYMGPYADADALAHKQAELRRLRGLRFEEVRSPASLAPGLSLGRFQHQDEAHAALEAIKQRGIRSARVLTLRPAAQLRVVRISQSDAAVRAALADLSLPQGKVFTPCQL